MVNIQRSVLYFPSTLSKRMN